MAAAGAPVPERAAAEWVEGVRGARLRAALLAPVGAARGSVVIHTGRTEFIEKYGEVAAEWRARGFAVLVHDWRGQGLSDRLLPDAAKGHARGWRAFVADQRRVLDAFADRLPRPWLALGHSMGGGLLALALMEGETRYAGAVLAAPMMAVATGRRSRRAVGAAALARTTFGGGAALPPVPVDPRYLRFDANVLTHDRARFARTAALIAAEPRLAVAGPTWSWLAFAFAVGAQLLRPGGPERVAIPVLVLLAGDDRVVLNAAAEAWAGRAPGARVVTVEGAWHELLMEADPLRSQAWAQMDAFAERFAPPLSAAV